MTIRRVQSYIVRPGKVAVRVQLKLTTADGAVRVWLSPEQAQELATNIMAVRFGLPYLFFKAPKRIRRGSFLTLRSSISRKLGERPSLREEDIKANERSEPEIRTKLKQYQDRWDRRAARINARRGPPTGFLRYLASEWSDYCDPLKLGKRMSGYKSR